ncbi:hypothetical protein CRYUN_Cryun27aG0048000 [Craigia yunnanensis]
MMLALALEKDNVKTRNIELLCLRSFRPTFLLNGFCYFNALSWHFQRMNIYWGHGIKGIESASNFYFGKHPSLLSLAESEMLAGHIPAPELRSPPRDQRSDKIFQARVLKSMVEDGSLDIEMALLTVRQPLYLHLNRPEHSDGLSYLLSFSGLGLGENKELNQIGKESTSKGTWDWEREQNM